MSALDELAEAARGIQTPPPSGPPLPLSYQPPPTKVRSVEAARAWAISWIIVGCIGLILIVAALMRKPGATVVVVPAKVSQPIAAPVQPPNRAAPSLSPSAEAYRSGLVSLTLVPRSARGDPAVLQLTFHHPHDKQFIRNVTESALEDFVKVTPQSRDLMAAAFDEKGNSLRVFYIYYASINEVRQYH